MQPLEPEQLIEFFSEQLERIDEKYNVHLTKIESKLDRLVELTSTVATLQERSSKQNLELIELKHDLKEHKDFDERMFKKIHDRIDANAAVIDSNEETIKTELRTIDNSVRKYIHIGVGICLAASVFISVIEWVGYEYVKNVKEDYMTVKARQELIIQDDKNLQIQNERQELRIKAIEERHPYSGFEHPSITGGNTK